MTRRVYECDDLTVSYDSAVCIHAAECVRGLPAVFTPDGRPWIHLEQATADQVAAVIRRCPSGALHYQRKDGLPEEQPATPATVAPQPNGPLYLRGDVTVTDADGAVVRRDTRMALCRCGASDHKPFCDNNHRLAGFQAP